MNLKKQIGAVLLALALAPAYVIAQDMEFNGTIVSKEEKSIKVKTKDGEKMLAIGTKTKGIEKRKGWRQGYHQIYREGWSAEGQRDQSTLIEIKDIKSKGGV